MPEAPRSSSEASSVWVTGAAQGIGRSIAEHLVRAGYRVWASDINAQRLTEAAVALSEDGEIHALPCDVTNPTAVTAAASRVAAISGRIDAVVNCAGVIHIDPILDLDYDTWSQVMKVNGDGVMLVGQASARVMVGQDLGPISQRRGLIINVGSAAAEWGRPRLAAYGASKAVVKHWSMSLGAALEGERVAVTLLYPGMVIDGMYRQIIEAEAALDGGDPDELEQERAAQAPAGRYQDPGELGPMVQHLIDSVGMTVTRKVLWSAPHMEDLS